MEEQVGSLWHKLITRAASTEYPDAAVYFADVAPVLGVVFRALGGGHATALHAGDRREMAFRRNWLQRMAGTHRKAAVGWVEEDAVFLPEYLAVYSDAALNRDLYLWLIALGSQLSGPIGDWAGDNQRLTRAALAAYPGLGRRYRRLVDALIPLRPAPQRLPPAEAALETAIQRALREPGRVGALPECEYAPCPVPLWLHPEPDRSGRSQLTADTRDESFTSRRATGRSRRRRKAEYVDHREDKNGLLAFRLESLFTWSEFVNVSRSHDDSEDPRAESVADDMDILSLARDRKLSAASALKFDLDLPAPAHDDLMLGEGIALPEWDYKQNRLVDGHCRLQPLVAEDAEPCPLPPRLRRTARTLRGQFEALAPLRMWHKRQSDGEEIDLDAWLEHRTEERLHKPAEQRVYKTFQGRTRDLACLLLADLSFSTDTWVNDQARVIDVIRDGLFVFSEALSAVQDRFALYGFSSRKRDHVRFNILKNFAEPHSDITRGRINAIRPGYYTRMGAPIRQATKILANEPAGRQLLLILTDGKPNDLDRYEGRYGVEDTRMAVHEARRAGLYPFCITIDEQAGDYLPYLFGSTGYALVRDPLQLPKKLAGLYWQLTE